MLCLLSIKSTLLLHVSYHLPPNFSRMIMSTTTTTRTFLLLFPFFLFLFTISWSIPHKYQSLNDRKQQKLMPFNEKDVVILREKNFSDFVAKNRYVLVDFYAPWCYWSGRLAPEYAAAATMLKGEAVLAMVDATYEKNLASKYEIQGYPSLYLFIGGIHKDTYYGDRTREAIATWVKRATGTRVLTITTTEEAELILSAESPRVVGFFDALEGAEIEEVDIVSKMQTEVNFYQTTKPEIAMIFGLGMQIKRPALIMLRKKARNYTLFDGQFSRCAISDFVSTNKFPLVATLNLENAQQISDDPMKKLWLCAYSNNSTNILFSFQEAAKIFKGKLLFVHMELDAQNDYQKLSYCGLGLPTDSPIIIASDDTNNYLMDGELNLIRIKSFAEAFLDGKLLSWSKYSRSY